MQITQVLYVVNRQNFPFRASHACMHYYSTVLITYKVENNLISTTHKNSHMKQRKVKNFVLNIVFLNRNANIFK